VSRSRRRKQRSIRSWCDSNLKVNNNWNPNLQVVQREELHPFPVRLVVYIRDGTVTINSIDTMQWGNNR